MSDTKVGLISMILASLAVIAFAYKASVDTALLKQQNQQFKQENHELQIQFEYYQRGVNDR